MPGQNAYTAYQVNHVQTQSQEKLVLMLYQGALRFIQQAVEAVGEGRYDRTSYWLGRAQEILSELRSNLNLEVGEVAHNLYALYDFMYWHLVRANVNKDVQMMKDVCGLLDELRETWEQAVDSCRSRNYLTRPNGLSLHG